MSLDIEKVFNCLTNEEKAKIISGTDSWHTATLLEHNIPAIRFSDGPNGIRGTKYFAGIPAACIPCGTALAATWDKQLLRKGGELLGKECIAKGVHCWLGPTINIQRSPLGGRGFESLSEDPHLSGILASNLIEGCESTGVISTVKHFVCNDQEHERRAVNTIITQRALREIYLRPFQIVARDAKPGALMTAYNKVNGCHVSENLDLLSKILYQEWCWEPLIISDWFGTYSTAGAINAGLDLEMPGPTRFRGSNVEFALSSRLIKQSVLDQRVRKVLEFINRASNTKVSEKESPRDLPEDRQLNRSICANSIVLLKNDDNILPLPKKMRKLALIGSHIKTSAVSGGGSAALEPYYVVNLFDAITQKIPDVEVAFEIGAYAHKMLPLITTMLSNGIIKFYNEPFKVIDREPVAHETMNTTYFQLMDYTNNKMLHFDLFYAKMEADFTPNDTGLWDFGLTVCGTANLYLDDNLLIDNTIVQRQGQSFFGKGTTEEIRSKYLLAGKIYKLRIEFGSFKTSTIKSIGVVSFGGGGARLGACLRIDTEEAITKAVTIAADSDYAVICTGLSSDWESEGWDRKHMDLPLNIDNLITRVLAANPKTVIVNQSGTPVTMPWIKSAKAVVQAWYGGNEIGNGISDVLFGDVNPGGKLPLSWPKRIQDNPTYHNFGSVGGRVLYGEDVYVGYRFYDKIDLEPLFPFGHGLSYTTFSLSSLTICSVSESISSSGIPSYIASMTITNTGSIPGSETIQIYISAPNSSISNSRPPKELHGFEKVFLQPKESKLVDVKIDKYATSYWDEIEGKWLSEKGTYYLLVGMSSRNIVLKAELNLTESRYWLGL